VDARQTPAKYEHVWVSKGLYGVGLKRRDRCVRSIRV